MLLLLSVLILPANMAMTVYANANGLADDQKKIYEKNILDFDINICGVDGNVSTNKDGTNNNLYVLGDSLTVGMRDSGNLKAKLTSAGWNVTDIEATTGDTIDDAISKISSDKSNSVSSAGTILVGLGTNPTSNPQKSVSDMIKQINNTSPGANIYWINAYSTSSDYNDLNSALESNVGTGDGKITKILDWKAEAKANASDYNLASGGGIHTTTSGYIKRAAWVADSLPPPTTSKGSGKITGGVAFDAGMSIDDDGVGSSHGDPNHQSQTSYANGKLNADTTNYIALAPGWASAHGLKLGDVAAVQYKGKTEFAVYGDNYMGNQVHGEGSLHLAIALGVTDSAHPGTSNADSGVHYVVFPGSNSKLNGSADQSKIDEIGAQVSGTGSAPSTSGGGSDSNSTPSKQAESLTSDQKISATFNIGFSASTPKDTIESVVKKYKIGGVFILGTSDAAGSGFTKSFFKKLNDAAGHTLVTSSDEEGVFSRYKYSFDFPDAKTMGGMSDSAVQSIGKKVGSALADNGINTDLAPVLDVSKDANGTDAGTAKRAFSNDPSVVTSKADAFAQGLQSAGVNPVYKHFPGLGSTSGNSDNGSVTSPSLDILKKADLKPYESISNKNGAAVMLDNAHVPGLTADNEVASISGATVKLLREDYNFTGLITTDDLSAGGVPVSLSSAISKSLQAGVDMPLFAYKDDASIDAAIGAAKNAGVNTDTPLKNIASFAGNASGQANSTATNLSSCCPPSASTQLTGDSNEAKIWNYFIGKGLNNIQVAGIMGNLKQESGFNPAALNPSSGAYGIGQWLGGRLTSLKSKQNYQDLSVQLDHMWSELSGPYKKAVLDPLMAAKDLQTAVDIWLEHYEIPCSPGQCGTELTKRTGFAQAWENKPGGGAGAGAEATDAAGGGDAKLSCSDASTATNGSNGTYSNPFHSKDGLVQSRIDEGVDYASTKPVPLYAIGNGEVTLATDKSTFFTTSHGHSDWITYKLSDGPAAGKYIYVSEACSPILVHTGQKITKDTQLCSVLPDSIEMGWAPSGSGVTGTEQYAAAHDVYQEGYETAYGVNFNKLMLSLGAMGGHLDTASDPSGKVLGTLPSGWPGWK